MISKSAISNERSGRASRGMDSGTVDCQGTQAQAAPVKARNAMTAIRSKVSGGPLRKNSADGPNNEMRKNGRAAHHLRKNFLR
jgi:hypothetical protein